MAPIHGYTMSSLYVCECVHVLCCGAVLMDNYDLHLAVAAAAAVAAAEIALCLMKHTD